MSDNTFKFVVFNWSNINNKPYLSNIDPTIDDYSNLNKIYWIENFDNIYNKNVGNVGIGRAIPEYKLDVDGEINASNF